MTQLVEFPLAAGGSVLVEVTEHAAGPVTPGLKGAEITEHARQSFEEAVSRIQPAVQGVIAQLSSLTKSTSSSASTCTLEAGAFIAAVSSTANFTVALTWRRTAP